MKKYFLKSLISLFICFISVGQLFATDKHPEFLGDLVIITYNSTIKAKLYVKSSYIHRVEMPEDAGGMIFISPENAKGKIWVLDPNKKQYKILSWPQVHRDPVKAWRDIQYDMGGGFQREEMLNGYKCTVYDFKYKDQDKIALRIWHAEDLHFTIKREADARIMVENGKPPETIKGTFEVLNIKIKNLDDSLFTVPDSYKEVK